MITFFFLTAQTNINVLDTIAANINLECTQESQEPEPSHKGNFIHAFPSVHQQSFSEVVHTAPW